MVLYQILRITEIDLEGIFERKVEVWKKSCPYNYDSKEDWFKWFLVILGRKQNRECNI